MKIAFALFYFLIVSLCAAQENYTTGLSVVNPSAIEATMSYLSDDLLEGRQPGTRGFALASKYIQTQFVSLGLKPGVDGKSYIQQVPFVKGVVEPTKSNLTFQYLGKEESLAYDSHFVLNPYFLRETSELTAPLVFVGYGITAPELHYDDYKNIDVKNKIVVFLNQAPETFPSNQRAYFTSLTTKYAEAVKRGAIGVIYFSMPGKSPANWEAVVRRAKGGSLKWSNKEGKAMNSFESLRALVSLNETQAAKIFEGTGKKLEEIYANAKAGKPHSFTLKVIVKVKVHTTISHIQSENLIGIIPGSDSILKKEFVVHAAHLDHFGVGAPVKKDSIYNGAHDNASGVAILLEIAHAYKSLETPPKRSVMIAVVTGEEYGLLGSDYLVNNCTVPLENIVANLTIDMPFFFHPVLDIVPYGAQHSSLSKEVNLAAGILKLPISPDPFPEQVVFIRSDHFSFIKKGIPSLFIKSGFMTVASDTVNRKISDVAWRTKIYHTPQDDMTQAFDFGGAATHAKINFLIGYLICQSPSRPSWNTGDFFGGRFVIKTANKSSSH